MFNEPLLIKKKSKEDYMTSSSPNNNNYPIAGGGSIMDDNKQEENNNDDDDTTTESKSSDVSTPLKVVRRKGSSGGGDDLVFRRSNSNNNNNNNNAFDEERPPSMVRRLSTQFTHELDHLNRQNSLNTVTNAVAQYIPDAIASNIPGLNQVTRGGKMQATYFCNICFTNYPLEEGFKLRNCQHMFCVECIKGFFTNKIQNGRVLHLKCFFPANADEACGIPIDDEDIRQVVDEEIWIKRQRYIANLENHLSRQCPYCDFTQIGAKEQPLMTCEQCSKQYCLYHSNAHPMSETCASYDLRMAKEDKLNQEAIGDAKPCPRCNFRIQKNGGCNHMKCVKCGCSFCWKCMQEIEDSELPDHYKSDGPCKGMQFDGMDSEPPRWVIAILVLCACIFFIPAAVLGLAFGICLCPLALLCACCGDEDGANMVLSLFQCCFLGWLAFFILVAIFLPLLLFAIVFEVAKLVYNIARMLCPCLPPCAEMNETQREQHRQRQAQQQQLWNDAVADFQNRNANDVVLDVH